MSADQSEDGGNTQSKQRNGKEEEVQESGGEEEQEEEEKGRSLDGNMKSEVKQDHEEEIFAHTNNHFPQAEVQNSSEKTFDNEKEQGQQTKRQTSNLPTENTSQQTSHQFLGFHTLQH